MAVFYRKNKDKKEKHWLDRTSFKVSVALASCLLAGLLVCFQNNYVFGADEPRVSFYEKKLIGPGDSFTVVFDRPVDTSLAERNFKIDPFKKVILKWKDGNRRLEIKACDFFDPGINYKIEMIIYEDWLTGKSEPTFLFFKVKSSPTVVEVTPANGEENISIDSSLKVAFDKSTQDYDVKIEIIPFGDGFNFTSDESKKEFTISPKDKLKWGTEYSIKVTEAVRYASDKNKTWLEVYKGGFKTESEIVIRSDTDSDSGRERERLTEKIEPKIKEGRYVDINLSKQHLSIFDDGKRLGTYKISSGKRGMATPVGSYKILKKTRKAWSSRYGLYMPYWMQFTSMGHGIHELPEWPGGYKEGANHLGIPVSHGCVRLGVGPAKTVYDFSDVGTPVVIHY